MKTFFLLLSMPVTIYSFGQTEEQDGFVVKNTPCTEVAAELLTDSTYWTIRTLSTIGYVNTTPGAYYNTYKNGGGMIVKFKFTKDGTYEFMLCIQANTYHKKRKNQRSLRPLVQLINNSKSKILCCLWRNCK